MSDAGQAGGLTRRASEQAWALINVSIVEANKIKIGTTNGISLLTMLLTHIQPRMQAAAAHALLNLAVNKKNKVRGSWALPFAIHGHVSCRGIRLATEANYIPLQPTAHERLPFHRPFR